MASLEGEPIPLAAPISGRIQLAPTGQRVLVRGQVGTVLNLNCSRCLEDFQQPVTEELFVVFSPGLEDATEEELDAESVNQEFYIGEEIDLWPVIQEHLIMGLPVKPLCREECAGLCPVCGRNKNMDECGCRVQTVPTGLACLAELKDKLPN